MMAMRGGDHDGASDEEQRHSGDDRMTVDIGGTMLQAEEAICAALNAAGVTAAALSRFDADGEPIDIGGEKWTAKTSDQYVKAAARDNTRKAYQGAVQHFEVEWGGFLPATAESVARYLVDHAETLSVNTLHQRLAALPQWHLDQGFPDPTKTPIVKKMFKGAQVLHPAQEKRAKPLQIEQLAQVDHWLENAIAEAKTKNDRRTELRYLRNRALLLPNVEPRHGR